MKAWLIRKLGGYATISEAIDEIEESEDLIFKHKILTLAVQRIFKAIIDEDVLTEKNNIWFFKGRALDASQKNALISQAADFQDSILWKILFQDMAHQSKKRMFLESKTEIDLIAGKLALFNLDVMKTRLKSMVKGTGLFNKNG